MDEAEKLRVALEMQDLGIQIMKSNLRRRFPDASDEEIRDRLRAWLLDRPPDAPGVISHRFDNP